MQALTLERQVHGDADGDLLGLEQVRQPGVAAPGPPEPGDDEQPLAEPSHVGSVDMRLVTRVRPKTKTRSKKSSSG
jgi:hypothetical protein